MINHVIDIFTVVDFICIQDPYVRTWYGHWVVMSLLGLK